MTVDRAAALLSALNWSVLGLVVVASILSRTVRDCVIERIARVVAEVSLAAERRRGREK